MVDVSAPPLITIQSIGGPFHCEPYTVLCENTRDAISGDVIEGRLMYNGVEVRRFIGSSSVSTILLLHAINDHQHELAAISKS